LKNIECERGRVVNSFHPKIFPSTVRALEFHQKRGILTRFAPKSYIVAFDRSYLNDAKIPAHNLNGSWIFRVFCL